ncbi:MAG: hypothetical protein WC891_07595 [Actinomycetota bacterium]
MSGLARLKRQAGYTLMETLLALSLIVLAFVAVLPLYFVLTNYVVNNRLRAVADNVASREMERIRKTSYNQVGIVGGNPNGIFLADRDEAQSSGGVFHIAVRISWVDDPMDGTAAAGTDALPNDFKLARVTVTKAGVAKPLAELSANISAESEESAITGGNIIAKAFLSDGVTSVSDARIDITTGPASPLAGWTNGEGSALFAQLAASVSPGDYSLKISKVGYVVRVDQEIQTTTVVFGQTRTVTFLIDQPGHLIVRLLDPGGTVINKYSKITLSNADFGDIKYTAATGLFDLASLFPGNYEISADAAAYSPTITPVSVIVAPNGSQTVNITLQPTPSGHLHLETFDAVTSGRLGIVDVALTDRTDGTVINAQTNTSGILEIDLEVAQYDIVITAAGYQPYSNLITITQSGNTNLNAYLQGYPTSGSVLVTAQTRSGAPRDNVQVRLIGGTVDVTGITGSYAPGQVLFIDVPPGNYTVYRWGGNGWRYPRNVTVAAGVQSSVVYSF